MRFDLVDLRLFLNVVAAGSITHGAELSNLTVGSASARIRAMEETLGAPLLVRQRHGVIPAPAGECLAGHARLILRQAEAMRSELAPFARGLTGTLRLVSNTAALSEHLPELLAGFLRANPSISIEVEEMESAAIGAAISAGDADIGIASASELPEALERLAFREDRLVVAVPRAEAREGAPLAFADIVERPFICLARGSALQRHIASQAARIGRTLKVRARVTSFDAMCQMVGAGAGIAILPEAAARRHGATADIATIPLADSWARRDLAICISATSRLPDAARRLAEHLCAQDRR